MTDEEAMKCVDYIRDHAPIYAKAKAKRVFIENGLKSTKAKLMAQETGTLGAKEIYAYSHPEYETVLKGLEEAVQIEEVTQTNQHSMRAGSVLSLCCLCRR